MEGWGRTKKQIYFMRIMKPISFDSTRPRKNALTFIIRFICKIKRDLHTKLKFDQDFIYHKYP